VRQSKWAHQGFFFTVFCILPPPSSPSNLHRNKFNINPISIEYHLKSGGARPFVCNYSNAISDEIKTDNKSWWRKAETLLNKILLL
jgi:hypothetical protein